ncbi:polysaccharide biosynthesis protein [Bacteroides ovatus]|uniref:polysaccharide biosynthesis protein n=1 Tax=Bacteroides ovatus TaxID=28116 RepID=UPI000E1D374B|nr:polysaccharide biosynthesis protein [Bacteroides ovatus]MDC2665537.1 polysaccharide biosynthesis protein [Bacteroides ovatus]MDC2680196.1 polysaccharide biosynthesis protein [Bacteroides ovatus]RDT81646.1 NAD-dependent epimerase/dehydratase family protein [Bacteroides ovatus]
MSIFAGKNLMITGGTGSFGNAVLNRFLQTDIKEIRIFSRDEKKQDDMRHEYQAKYPEYAGKIKFFIGDVRNLQSCKDAMPGVDYIFHAAALKQVPSCEFFPMEAVKTNVIGTDNVLTAAIEAGVKAVICLSTDKAAYPINAMGITKAIEEKIAVAKSRYSGETKICCTRYGNVMCSRGSVIPLWIDQIRNGNPITLTESKMTRFIMSLEEAVDLVLFAFEHGQNGDILVQKAPACTIQTQAEAVCELFGGKKEDIKVIGIRHGEKMYETLLTNEECAKAEDMGDFYRVPADNRSLNYDKYFTEGDEKRCELTEFNSDNTRRLNLEETKVKIANLEYIQNELAGIPNLAKKLF